MVVRMYTAMALLSLLLAFLWHSLALPVSKPDTFIAHFYQQVIGELDGKSCPSYPVCSSYAARAVQGYGLLTGSWLALDRLIHEADDLQRGPWIVFDGAERLYDPLSRNTRWLQEK
ncbi:MAG: membrane protein insertion efficiency factor YidD [Mariprofundus sp.]